MGMHTRMIVGNLGQGYFANTAHAHFEDDMGVSLWYITTSILAQKVAH